MELLDNLRDNFSAFFRENTKLTVTIIGILVFFFSSGLIILLVQLSKEQPVTKPVSLPGEVYSPVEEYFKPASQTLTEGYYFSHTANTGDTETWFTEPDKKALNDLSNANDTLIETITGAAP